jgi:serine/threonine-protein kinase
MVKVVPSAGDTIADRYILERAIAEGGMGSVWRAKHRTLGRCFAVKFLKPDMLGGEPLEQRFLREARLAASIQHRFVVDIVDYGVGASMGGTPYMVMEFLEGESLDHRHRRAPPLTVRQLLRICAETLLGLEAVHQAGVVHRDLKPENIMLVREADGVIPKLIDFGISSPEVERADSRKRITQPGVFVGTPWYMSPEQVRRDEADRRSDIYSMGVILYEGVIGEAPYDHEDLADLLDAVKAGGAPTLRERRPELGADLSAIVERAMALDPEARFQSAAEMAARLFEVAAQLPDTLRCPAPPTVTRTDTELVDRAPPAARNVTCELALTRQEVLVRRAGASQWRRERRERLVALGGALLAAALLVWAADKARDLPSGSPARPKAPAALAHAASTSTSTSTSPAPARDPAVPRPATARESATTLAATAPAGVAANEPAAAAPAGPARTGRGAPRRASASDARPREVPATPDVFRSPGF